MKKSSRLTGSAWGIVLGSGLMLGVSATAGMITDKHGNTGYDTAAECDAAVTSGAAKFYESFTSHPALMRSGEVSVKKMKLSELVIAQQAATGMGYNAANYPNGACDIGVGRSHNRDGVSPALIGKYVPFAPSMAVNVYHDQQDRPVRATMLQCDNNFGKNMPRPVANLVVAKTASECFATVQTAAVFETRTEQVVKTPATKRIEVVPATYKTISEQVQLAPEFKKQIPILATYKTVTEEVVVSPATYREEPVPATYKTVTEDILVKPASTRVIVTPATFKTVTEQVVATPARKELKILPAEYAETSETVVDRPATVRVDSIAATYKTVTEQVLVKAESLRYEPIQLPLRRVSENVLRTQASTRLEVVQPTMSVVTERVIAKEASKRLEVIPAIFETMSEQIKTADATREWKRGRAWIGQAINVRPLRGFVVEKEGHVDGNKVALLAASGGSSKGVVDTFSVIGDNKNLDDDVMCLVETPAQYQIISRQVLKSPATVREVIVPAEYATVTRQVITTEANSREVEIPATYQTVTHQEIDLGQLRSQGYRIDDKGDIVAMPNGDRVLRAVTVAGLTGSNKTAGAQSGLEGYVHEIKIPAEYRTLTRQVVENPASVRMVEIPATTKTVKSTTVTSPAHTSEITIPATYKTVSRQIVNTPASSNEIAVPAESRTMKRQVEDIAATTKKIPVAAVTKTLSRRVVETPASFSEETVAAVYKTVTRQVVDQPASTREIDLPAKMETLSYQFKLSDASTQRRSILCETNATPSKISEIQRALKQAGYNPGPINGVIRAQTMQAVNQYQQSKGLPVDGFLNLETVKSLGVTPN